MNEQLDPSGPGWRVLLLDASILLILAVPLIAQVAQTAPQAPRPTSPAPLANRGASSEADGVLSVTVAGVMVQIDRRTGRLRAPTPEEAKALREAMLRRFGAQETGQVRASSQPSVSVQPDGTLMAEVPPQLHEVSIVRLTAQGTLIQECTQGVEHATALLGETPPSNPVRGTAAEER